MKKTVRLILGMAILGIAIMSCEKDNDGGKENGNNNNNSSGSLDNWKYLDFPEARYLRSITFGNGKFVIGGGGDNCIFYSDDNGKTWNKNDIDFSFAIAIYDGTKFVGHGGSKIYSATDPAGKWTLACDLPDSYGELAYGGGYYVLAGYKGNILYSTSIDGEWKSNKIDTEFNVYDIIYANNKFVVVGEDGLVAYTDNPAKEWKVVENHPFDDAHLRGIIFDGKNYVLVGGDEIVAYSTDLESWNRKTVGSSNTCIVYANNYYLLGAINLLVYTTNITSTWTTVKDGPFPGLSSNVEKIAFGNNTFVAIGNAYNVPRIAYTTVK